MRGEGGIGAKIGRYALMLFGLVVTIGPFLLPFVIAWYAFQEHGIKPFLVMASIVLPFIVAIALWSKNEKIAQCIFGAAVVYLLGTGIFFFIKNQREAAEDKQNYVETILGEYLYDNRGSRDPNKRAEEIYDLIKDVERDYDEMNRR